MDVTWPLVMANGLAIAAYLATMGVASVSLSRHRARLAKPLDRAPRVTLFKPLSGVDDDLPANLESFAKLDYPEFEILFGVADADDPAGHLARRFIAAHPEVQAKLIVTRRGAALNPKVAQLLGLERAATGSIYVISDSNVRVAPDYLWGLVRELEDPGVGVVTHAFAGTGERTLGAALENLQVCTVASPGVMAIDRVFARPPTVGKSMALRRRDLATIGGFARVGDVLAEDQILGDIFRQAGFAARLCLDLVENRNVDCSIARTFERHTRWAQIRRSLMPHNFMWEPLLNPIIIAALSVALNPGRPMLEFFFGVLFVQTWLSLRMVRLMRGHAMALKYAPLELVRSFVVTYCWCAAWTTRMVEWRGNRMRLDAGTKIVPVYDSSLTLVERLSPTELYRRLTR